MFGLAGQNDREKEFRELEKRVEALDSQVAALFEQLGVTPEQIHLFINDRGNFTENNWEELQKERQKLDLKLQRDLENIPDPKRIKKEYQERDVAQNWLFVK